VRVYQGGAMGTWLAGARPGAELSLGRPSGTCCYQPGEPGAPLLLAGTGTGVAPLAAVARDALAHGHHGPIVLLRGAAYASGLFPDLPPEPVRLRTCVLASGGDVVAAVVAEYAALINRAGLAGPPVVADPAALASHAGPAGVTEVTQVTGVAGVAGLSDRARAGGARGTDATQVYLCGGPGVVARMRRALFLAGQSLGRIHCDEFSPAAGGSS
jgi:CDP-4-dehydro-6-deoxyglucose reductase, E3